MEAILILLAEDDQQVREMIEEYLEIWGYNNMVSATNGEEALAYVRTSPIAFDLVITDEIMPKVKGSAVIAYIEEHHPATRIIHMSDKQLPGGSPSTRRRISKPLHFPELKGLIEEFFPPSGKKVALPSI